MIIKGASRAGPDQLAAHLLRTDTNERVEIVELQSPAGTLGTAFRDWQLLSEATHGTRGLYHANIDPDQDATMTPDQWERAVDVLEHELGLDGQPRAVVVHQKHGRTHAHVVWCRTNADTLTMVRDSWNYLAHERASMTLEDEFGHERVPGKHAKRDREAQPEFPGQDFTHAEWQQAERADLDPRARKALVTDIYSRSDSGQAFVNALAEQGYLVAQGDRRDFVLVDPGGHVLALTRQIDGMKAKELRAFMADVDLATIPTVEQAKEQQKTHQNPQQARAAVEGQTAQPEPALPESAPEHRPEAQAKTSDVKAGDKSDDRAEEQAEQEKQESAKASAQTEALEKALDARETRERKILEARLKAEREQLEKVLADDTKERLADQNALHDATQRRWTRENPERKRGLDAVLEAIERRLNPAAVTEKKLQREKNWKSLLASQAKERNDLSALLNQTRDMELENLDTRHGFARDDLESRIQKDRERYAREHAQAARLIAEYEERQRQLAEERGHSRDGPGRAR